MELEIEGVRHHATTVLVSTDGALIRSPALSRRGARLKLTNLESGKTTDAQVAWSWAQGSATKTRARLALQFVGDEAGFWGAAYDRLAIRAPTRAFDRRRPDRRETELELELECTALTATARTIDISARGAGVRSEDFFRPDTVVQVRLSREQRDARFRVVWIRPMDAAWAPSGFRLGLEMLEKQERFWPTERPAWSPR